MSFASARRKSPTPNESGAAGEAHPQSVPAHSATDSLGSPASPSKGQPAPSGGKVSAGTKGVRLAASVDPKWLTPSMVEAAKIHRKKGTRLPPVLIAAKTSEIEWKRGEYAVYLDRNSYSCIKVSGSSTVIEFIPMTSGPLRVHRSGAASFNERWKPFIHPLKRAAEVFAEGAKHRGITAEAREHLVKILGRPLNNLTEVTDEDDNVAKKSKAVKGEAEAAATEAAAAPAEAPAEEKAAKKGKATVTTVKNGKKTVKQVDKAPEPKAKEDKVKFLSKDEAAKLIKAGGKLKKGRENDTRKGSLRWAAIEAVISASTVEAALKASFKFKGIKQQVKFTDVRSAVRRGYVVVSKK